MGRSTITRAYAAYVSSRLSSGNPYAPPARDREPEPPGAASPLAWRSAAVTWALAIFSGANLLGGGFTLTLSLFTSGGEDFGAVRSQLPLLPGTSRAISALSMLSFLCCVVLVPLWVHRATRNAWSFDAASMRSSPGWSAAWFFVPVANLWKPFESIKDIWSASRCETRGSLLTVWWASWLLGTLTSNLGRAMRPPGLGFQGSLYTLAVGFELTVSISLAVAALSLIAIVREVTRAQERMLAQPVMLPACRDGSP